MRARTSLLLERTRTDVIGICCVVYPANGQSRITPSLPCQFPITTRSTAPMAHCGRFGKRIGINEMTGRIRQRPSQLQHSFAVNFGAFLVLPIWVKAAGHRRTPKRGRPRGAPFRACVLECVRCCAAFAFRSIMPSPEQV